MSGHVEIDETYVGGKPRAYDKRSRAMKVADKSTVWGAVERDGKVRAEIVPFSGAGDIRPRVFDNVKAGSKLYTDGRMTRIEPQPVEAIDATAAGDAFVGAVAFAIARGAHIPDAVRLGGAAGAAAATKLGARPSLPFPEDLKRLFGIELDDVHD